MERFSSMPDDRIVHEPLSCNFQPFSVIRQSVHNPAYNALYESPVNKYANRRIRHRVCVLTFILVFNLATRTRFNAKLLLPDDRTKRETQGCNLEPSCSIH